MFLYLHYLFIYRNNTIANNKFLGIQKLYQIDKQLMDKGRLGSNL